MGDAHPAGKGHFRGRIGNQRQRHRLILLSPSSCSATAPLEMPMPSALHELQCPVGDKPRLTIATDTSLMMQEDSFHQFPPRELSPAGSSGRAKLPRCLSQSHPRVQWLRCGQRRICTNTPGSYTAPGDPWLGRLHFSIILLRERQNPGCEENTEPFGSASLINAYLLLIYQGPAKYGFGWKRKQVPAPRLF